MSEKKKVDIFKLYQRDKVVKIEDNQGNYAEILLVKLTHAEKRKALEHFRLKQREETDRLRSDNNEMTEIKKLISNLTIEEIVNGTIDVERVMKSQFVDLMNNEDNKTEEELLKEWEAVRRRELLVMDKEQLQNNFIDLRISSIAAVVAGAHYDLAVLSYMCRDVSTRKRIFNSVEDVENVIDKRILDTLNKESIELRTIENDQDMRKAADDNDFFPTGESVSNSGDSPVITT